MLTYVHTLTKPDQWIIERRCIKAGRLRTVVSMQLRKDDMHNHRASGMVLQAPVGNSCVLTTLKPLGMLLYVLLDETGNCHHSSLYALVVVVAMSSTQCAHKQRQVDRTNSTLLLYACLHIQLVRKMFTRMV
jgi:hypothetical protein